MKNLDTVKKILQEHDADLKKRFKVKSLGIFGSYVRGEQEFQSDIDLLVEFSEPVGWEFIDLKDYLEDLLGMEVDLVTPNALRKHLKETILNEVVYL